MNCMDIDQVTKDAVEIAQEAYRRFGKPSQSRLADPLDTEKEFQIRCGLFLLNDEPSYTYELKIRALKESVSSGSKMSAVEFIQKVEKHAEYLSHIEAQNKHKQKDLEKILLEISSAPDISKRLSDRENIFKKEYDAFLNFQHNNLMLVERWSEDLSEESLTKEKKNKQRKQFLFDLNTVFTKNIFHVDVMDIQSLREKMIKECHNVYMMAIKFPEGGAVVKLTQEQKSNIQKDFDNIVNTYNTPHMEEINSQKISDRREQEYALQYATDLKRGSSY